LNTKITGLIVTIILLFAISAAVLLSPPSSQAQNPTTSLDFTVGGKNDCLRFLNDSVSVAYVSFTVAANHQGQLTINCTQMPGGANGYTDLYIYNGYWDNGTNHIATSRSLYPILSNILNANYELKGTTAYNATYGGSAQQSFTVFFILPPGGQSSFHITYKQLN
jgi:hypothetical protein